MPSWPFSSRPRPKYAPGYLRVLRVLTGRETHGVLTGRETHEWLRATCMPALASLVRLQSRFARRLQPQLPRLLALIESCVTQEIEGLARIGVS